MLATPALIHFTEEKIGMSLLAISVPLAQGLKNL